MQPLKMVSKTFMMENAHSRMCNETELNLGEGTRGLIRTVGPSSRCESWGLGTGKEGSPPCSTLILSTIWGLFVAPD